MLQFLTSASNKYTIAEEARMALEGGCRWIQVTKSLPAGVTMKDVLMELTPLCRENEAFLMIDSDVELANEMRVHGVHLGKNDMKPAEARELLGPHAVIGVDAGSADDILALRGLDIDYAVIEYGTKHDVDNIRSIIKEIRANGMEIHIVARGDLQAPAIMELKQAGISGFALSGPIINSADPVTATADILNLLNR